MALSLKGDSSTLKILIVPVSDLHTGSTVGMCPPRFLLDDGGVYTPSKAQRWQWSKWLEFWQEVAAVEADEKWLVLCGDAADRNGRAQSVTSNKAMILRAALDVLDPALQVTDTYFVIRGTEWHTGSSAWMEENIGEEIDAQKDDEACSWWYLRLETEGIRLDFSHHPATYSRRPWTRGAAPARQSAILAMEYARSGEQVPDVAVYGHVHGYDESGKAALPRVFFLPPWQLTTAFGYRIGAAPRIEPPGGLLLTCEDGQYSVRDIRFKPQRRKVWTRK